MSKIHGKQIQLNTNPVLGTSNVSIPSEYAVKQYVDTKVSQSQSIIYSYIIPRATVSPASISHNLGTFDFIASVYNNVTGEDVVVNIDRISSNVLEVSYSVLDNDLTVLIFAGNAVVSGTSGLSQPSTKQSNEVTLDIIITNSYNATIYSHYLQYNHNAVGTIYLPASPKFGQQIVIADMTGNASTYHITINGNGKNINNLSSITIQQNYGTVLLIYNSNFWSLSRPS
jgi:hypothetical protein